MKVVKNDVVEMPWNVDGFIESRKDGFVAAVHSYNGVPIAFKEGKAYTHADDDGEIIGFKDLVSVIKRASKERDSDYPEFYDDYVEIYDGCDFTNEGFMEYHGILDCKDDILARLQDLSGYWVIEEESMIQ